MAITAAEQTFFNNAINTVFRDDKDDLIHALKFLNKNSDNIPLLLAKLDKLCGCSFSDKAGLQNNPAPQAVADSISIAVTAAGGTPSDAVALKRKVGNAELTTTAKDLSGAVNELAGVGAYTPVGTLKSFYSCTSLSDTNPTLIATGSTTLDGMVQARQKCINWAYSKQWESTSSSIIIADKGAAHTYVSSSSSGGCYDAVGELKTQVAVANLISSNSGAFNSWGPVIINSIKVICSSSICKTESQLIEGTGSALINLPELPVSCSETTCTTTAKYINSFYTVYITSKTVYCGSFPCTLEGYDAGIATIGDRTITCISDVCSSSEIITNSNSYNSFYIPSQSVTCIGDICSIGSAQYEPISLTIPVRSTTCTESDGDGVIDCSNIAASSILTDSIGGSVTVPETTITCSNTYDTCRTAATTITITNSLGDYQYYIDSQPLLCTESSCFILETIIYSHGSNSQKFFYIPALTAEATPATAGSLENLCMHSLDY